MMMTSDGVHDGDEHLFDGHQADVIPQSSLDNELYDRPVRENNVTSSFVRNIPRRRRRKRNSAIWSTRSGPAARRRIQSRIGWSRNSGPRSSVAS